MMNLSNWTFLMDQYGIEFVNTALESADGHRRVFHRLRLNQRWGMHRMVPLMMIPHRPCPTGSGQKLQNILGTMDCV
jgi:hypothetical protein